MIRIIKFLVRYLLKVLYGVKVSGMENYQKAGDRVLIVANHTSLLDGVLLYAWLPETPTFAINSDIAKRKLFKFFLLFVDLFEMAQTGPLSIKSLIKFIQKDKKAVIFPEGRITITGTLMKIYEGPGLVADKANATILPIAIDGAQLSTFSYMKGINHVRWFPRISIKVLPPEKINIKPEIIGHRRRNIVSMMMQKIMLRLQFETYDYQKTIFSSLLESANRFGHGVTILKDTTGEVLSYRGLLIKTFIIARAFARNSVPDGNIGLLLPNINATVISFLACQYLGRIPAMLNFTSGTQNILKACKTANITTVYSSANFIEKAGLELLIKELDQQLKVIYVEDLRNQITIIDKCQGLLKAMIPRLTYRKRAKSTSPDSPAVILFTSGSEDAPKGVVLSHSNVLSNFAQVRIHIDFKTSDTVFTCLPLFHSFGLNAGTLMPLLGGSMVFLYPTPLHYRVIPQLIYELSATILFGTNTFFKGYAKHAHPYDFNTLRYTVAGAEKLREDTKLLWMEKFGIRIFEGYGVTETSPVISVNTPIIYKPNSVGLPLPAMDYYLLPVEGIERGGRLVVKGPNIMKGYLLSDSEGEIIPPVTEGNEGWHDTGDIACIDDDGYISIIGRAKRFAKLGGEMVSLSAVEELAIQTWPRFSHAAVSLADDKKGEKIVLITDYNNANRKAIQETARKLKYAEIYVPKKVVLAEELPVLSTGKIDYLTLTAMAEAEDKEGTGWIGKLTGLMKKTDNEVTEESDQN